MHETGRMNLNHGLDNKYDLMTEKSDTESIQSENPARIEDIFEWIDGLPLSKTTKNLARDFSDAVLMSEILKYYYPHYVKSHNYIPANSVKTKKENWNTLNRKVLSRIDLRLSSDTIDQLSHSQVGIIDKVLSDFRDKQMSVRNKERENLPALKQDESNLEMNKLALHLAQPKTSIFSRIYRFFKNFFCIIFKILLAIICFWKWFSRKPKSESVTITAEASKDKKGKREISETTMKRPYEETEVYTYEQERKILQDSYDRSLEELRIKTDVIKNLYDKVSMLENLIKVKDSKIISLSNQLEHNNTDLVLPISNRPNIPVPINSKVRRKTRM